MAFIADAVQQLLLSCMPLEQQASKARNVLLSSTSAIYCRAVPDDQVVGVLLAQHLAPQLGRAAQSHELRKYAQTPQASLVVLMQRPWQAADKPVYSAVDKSADAGLSACWQMRS